MKNKFKLKKIIINLLLIIAVAVLLLTLVYSNISTASGESTKMEKKTILANEESTMIYGNFMTTFYPVLIGKNVDFNRLPPDSLQIYLNKILNLCPNISPINIIDSFQISSKFGERISPNTRKHEFHQGIDIKATINTKINSTMYGEVEKIYVEDTINKFSGYGNCIVIKNSLGFETLYGHLKRMYVKRGQLVEKGQLIATVGISGNATGPNLHYEIHQNGDLKDPMNLLFIRSKNIPNIIYENNNNVLDNITSINFNKSK